MRRQQVSWRSTGTVFVSGCVLLLALINSDQAQAADKVKDCPAVPNWGIKLPADQRFVPALVEVVGGFVNVAAYCDRETGLVWPRTLSARDIFNWEQALAHCAHLSVAGRMGWHLPLVHQLTSLVDTNAAPALPPGHPFNVPTDSVNYWSATASARLSGRVVGMDFSGTSGISTIMKSTTGLHTWCVRGGQEFDGNTHQTLH